MEENVAYHQIIGTASRREEEGNSASNTRDIMSENMLMEENIAYSQTTHGGRCDTDEGTQDTEEHQYYEIVDLHAATRPVPEQHDEDGYENPRLV